MWAGVRVTGFGPDDITGDDGVFIDDLESVRVPINENQDRSTHECTHCGEGLADYGTEGWHGDDGLTCDQNDDGPHEAKGVPLMWCNSAALHFDDAQDSITATISVGDPRGAFAFTVRRRPDTGELIMHLPYPGEGLPHMTLTLLHDGTYRIGD